MTLFRPSVTFVDGERVDGPDGEDVGEQHLGEDAVRVEVLRKVDDVVGGRILYGGVLHEDDSSRLDEEARRTRLPLDVKHVKVVRLARLRQGHAGSLRVTYTTLRYNMHTKSCVYVCVSVHVSYGILCIQVFVWFYCPPEL